MTKNEIFAEFNRLISNITPDTQTIEHINHYLSGDTNALNLIQPVKPTTSYYAMRIVSRIAYEVLNESEVSETASQIFKVCHKLLKNNIEFYSEIRAFKKAGIPFREIVEYPLSSELPTTTFSGGVNRSIAFYEDISKNIAENYSEEFLDYISSGGNAITPTFMAYIFISFIKADPQKYSHFTNEVVKLIDGGRIIELPRFLADIHKINDAFLNKMFEYIDKSVSNAHLVYVCLAHKYFCNLMQESGRTETLIRMLLSYYPEYYNDMINTSLESLYKSNPTAYKKILDELTDASSRKYNSAIGILPLIKAQDEELSKYLEKVAERTDLFMKEASNSRVSDFKISDLTKIKQLSELEFISKEDIENTGLPFDKRLYFLSTTIPLTLLIILSKYFETAKKYLKVLTYIILYASHENSIARLYKEFADYFKSIFSFSPQQTAEFFTDKIMCKNPDVFFKVYIITNSKGWYYPYKTDIYIVHYMIEKYPEKAAQIFDNLTAAHMSVWLEAYYSCENISKNFTPLLNALKAKSKVARKTALSIAFGYEDELRTAVVESMKKLKGDSLITAQTLIKNWDNARKFGKDFSFTNDELTEQYCLDNLSSLLCRKISWIPDFVYENIHFSETGKLAPPEVLKYIISEYMALDEPRRLPDADKIAVRLKTDELQEALENIFSVWLDGGADTKRKFITLPYCIYASDTQIAKLKKQLEVWAKASRGAIAAFTVGNMALNGGSIALMTVDSISKKFPNAMVKNAAKNAFGFAAETLGIPIDELSDKIVPNLNFDRYGCKILSYGERSFKITLMPDFSLSIFDTAKNKTIKSMPKPSASDDPAIAETSKKEFSDTKKQIKLITSNQKARLERVLIGGRKWSCESWRKLFEENPIMHVFSEKLIWGTYDSDDNLLASFRYLSDGSFCNEDDDEFTLPDDALITLVHPSQLSEETLSKWLEQLDDYEIIQPFPQLNMPVTELQEDDIKNKCNIIKYKDRESVFAKIKNIADKYGLERGETGDGGSYDGYELTDKALGITACFNFDCVYFGMAYDETAKFEDLVFYPADRNFKTPPLEISSINKRFLNSCLAIAESMLN